MAKLKDAHVLSDTDWALAPGANPRRGYHDYIRTIVFTDDTSPKIQQDTIDAVMAPYKNKGGPTWSYFKKNPNNSWHMRQGYDSGD